MIQPSISADRLPLPSGELPAANSMAIRQMCLTSKCSHLPLRSAMDFGEVIAVCGSRFSCFRIRYGHFAGFYHTGWRLVFVSRFSCCAGRLDTDLVLGKGSGCSESSPASRSLVKVCMGLCFKLDNELAGIPFAKIDANVVTMQIQIPCSRCQIGRNSLICFCGWRFLLTSC